jgi:hypothetical protein
MRNTVKKIIVTIFGMFLMVSPALAHGNGGGFGLSGDFGGFGLPGFGFGDRFGGYGGLGLFGGNFGLGLFDAERTQTRFENQFDALKTKYDEGVANTTDFFNSTEYDRIVNRTERLDDNYGFFVGGVERSIDRLGDIISIANDDLTYFNDLLADYQADTSLSPERLARIEARIDRITDRITTGIDFLTDKQTTLQTNLPTYQTFQTDISTFLSDIVAAGGGTSSALTSALSASFLAESSSSDYGLASVSSQLAVSNTGMGLSPSNVPEPQTAVLAVVALGAIVAATGRRTARH